MFKLFDRYILREISPPFFIGLIVYTFVLLMNQILLLSELFIARGVSLSDVLLLLIYLIPSILSFTVPMAVLMGILAGLSRMSSDAEITAFKTLGINYKRILRPVLLFSFGGWIVTSFLILYLSPHANYLWVKTLSSSVLTKVQLKINAREFHESIPNTVIFVQDISSEKTWENILVHFTHPAEEPRIIFAEEGRLNFYPKEQRAILELFKGSLHSYPLSNPEKYRVTSFERLEEELDVDQLFASLSPAKRVREKDIRELLSGVKNLKQELQALSDTQEGSLAFRQKQREYFSHWIEVHKKMALPFACFIFAFLGISLGASTRKGGRTSGFTISIAIILIYYILITAGENLAMDGKISAFSGMWGPNILMGLCALYFFIKSLTESPLLPRIPQFFKKSKSGTPSAQRKGSISSFPRFSFRLPNILDRYILRKYLFLIALVLTSLLSVFVIVTFFERIDKVYEHNKSLGLFFEFIWFKIPEFLHYTLPLAALVATLLTLGLLTKFNEITAMKACGLSLYRIVLPVIIMGVVVSALSFYVQENILPYSNKKAEEIWSKINDLPPRSFSYLDRRWLLGKEKNRIYYYKYFDPVASSFSQLSVFEFTPGMWSLSKRIYSEKGYIKDQKLHLVNSWIRTFQDGKPVEFEKKPEMSLPEVEEKAYFLKEGKVPDQMNFPELRRYVKEIEKKGFETTRFKVDLNFKVSFPFAGLIMTLIGIPFAFSVGKRGALAGIGLSVVIAMIYWGTLGIFKSLGYVNYLNAFLAAWGPNLIFGLIGLYLVFTLRT